MIFRLFNDAVSNPDRTFHGFPNLQIYDDCAKDEGIAP